MKYFINIACLLLAHCICQGQTYEDDYANAYRFWGEDWAQCEEHARLALDKAHTDRQKADAYLMLEQSIDGQGQPAQAIPAAFEALKRYRVLGDEAMEGDMLLEIAELFNQCHALREALNIYQDVIAIKMRLQDSLMLAAAYRNIGAIHAYMNDYDSALFYAHLALQGYNSLGKAEKVARVLNDMGLAFHGLGQYDVGIEHYFSALRYDSSDDRQAKTYNNVGWSLMEAGRHKQAKPYLLRSYQLKADWRDRSSLTRTYNNLAEVYQVDGNIDSARWYIARSYAIVDSTNTEFIATHRLYQELNYNLAAVSESSQAVLNYSEYLEDLSEKVQQLYQYYLLQNELHHLRQEELLEQHQRKTTRWLAVLIVLLLLLIGTVVAFLIMLKRRHTAKQLVGQFIKYRFE